MSPRRRLQLPTADPLTGEELVVTRLENPSTGMAIEGEFSMGWIGRLTAEQFDFVGVLLSRRNNLQRLASDLGIAYNTARNRFEEIVAALGAQPADDDPSDGSSNASEPRPDRRDVLRRVAAGELSVDEARRLL